MRYPFFERLIFKIRLAKASKRKMLVFSVLNDKSFSLAKSLLKKKENMGCSIIFASAMQEKRAKDIGALCFAGNITELCMNGAGTEITFFIMDEEETDKLSKAMNLYSKYKGKKRVSIYVFSQSEGTQVAVESAVKALGTKEKGLSVYIVDDMQFLSLEVMKQADVLSRTRTKTKNGERIISALFTGLDKKGMAILKTLLWYCRMDNIFLEVNVIDTTGSDAQRFEKQCPEIVEKNNSTDFCDAGYSIKFIEGTNLSVGGLDWVLKDKGLDRNERDSVERIERTSVVFVTKGRDAEIIKNAVELRRLFDRLDIARIRELVESAGVSKQSSFAQVEKMLASEKKSGCDYPYIYACVENADIYETVNAFGGLKDSLGTSYNISFAGGNNSVYCADVLKPFNMEEEYKKAAEQKGFTKAEALFEAQYQTAKNIYLRTQGYCYSGSADESTTKERGKLLCTLAPVRKSK